MPDCQPAAAWPGPVRHILRTISGVLEPQQVAVLICSHALHRLHMTLSLRVRAWTCSLLTHAAACCPSMLLYCDATLSCYLTRSAAPCLTHTSCSILSSSLLFIHVVRPSKCWVAQHSAKACSGASRLLDIAQHVHAILWQSKLSSMNPSGGTQYQPQTS